MSYDNVDPIESVQSLRIHILTNIGFYFLIYSSSELLLHPKSTIFKIRLFFMKMTEVNGYKLTLIICRIVEFKWQRQCFKVESQLCNQCTGITYEKYFDSDWEIGNFIHIIGFFDIVKILKTN